MTTTTVSYRVLNPRAPRLVVDKRIKAIANNMAADLQAGEVRGRTGQLAGGWHVTRGRVTACYLVQNDVPYLKYVEYGTRHMPARPVAGRVLAQYRARYGR